MSNYTQLQEVLSDIFELNKADLDFGIYRIMNQKRKEINQFLTVDLEKDIKAALSNTTSNDQVELEQALKKIEKDCESLGVVKEENAKYILAKELFDGYQNTEAMEQEVFSHLANFFRRYYKDGDFISMRRYKKDVYAIPYEGEEVKLHWANHDQYYIKSSENFKNYSFLLADGKKINFNLKEATTEQNNNKSQGDAERRFAIYKEIPVEEIDGELCINFIYETFPKSTKQDQLSAEAIEIILEDAPDSFSGIKTLFPTEKNKSRTLVEKHLTDFVSRNSFDYFIHKDLGGFLQRELDFYIKNEVLYIDDINEKQTEFFTAQLSKIKALKAVATKIITFLASIENFQKKLWLKKKMVIRTDYLITLDRIAPEFYADILANEKQQAEWKTLFDIKINSEEELASEQFLVLDTQFYSEEFKDKLLGTFENLDENTNGLLINSENFQALNLLQEKYREKVKSNYIDPPYNSDASKIAYKNDYEHSSWLTFLSDRVILSRQLLSEDGILQVAIDDIEFSLLEQLLKNKYGSSNYIGNIAIMNNPKGRDSSFFASSHEYTLLVGKNSEKSTMNRLQLEQTAIEKKYPKIIDEQRFRELPLRRSGSEANRKDRPYMYFPFIFKNDKLETIEQDEYEKIYHQNKFDDIYVNDLKQKYETEGYKFFLPIREDGTFGRWRWGFETCTKGCLNNSLIQKGNTIYQIDLADETYLPKSFWYGESHDSSSKGTNLLKKILPNNPFDYPKSLPTVIDFINLTSNKDSIVLDYFGGSGTTGHATIKLNREDEGNRKYILVEMGTYFNTVTKPRIAKVIYTDNWKNGKPQDKAGISQMVKYQILESYEDTLNNLFLEPTEAQQQIDFTERASREYLLHYMLDVESRDQLFNIEMFAKPFDYKLKITENNELVPTQVDLVETFNYLIGLYVSKIQRVKDIKVIEGVTREGLKTLVIWRDTETTTHDEVLKLVKRFYDSQRTQEFQQIYINGDHHLENLRQEGDQFKIKLIEDTFFKKMFNETEL